MLFIFTLRLMNYWYFGQAEQTKNWEIWPNIIIYLLVLIISEESQK